MAPFLSPTAANFHAMSSAPTNILLLRHGQSEWNADGRWQGLADPPLSHLGRRQAIIAVKHLGTVDYIVSSDLRRAAETAEILANGVGIGPVIFDVRLRERDAGEWTGLTRNDIAAKWPGAMERGDRPPGFEPDESVLPRVLAAIVATHRRVPGGDVVLVAHGGVVRAMERHLGAEEGLLPNLGGRWIIVRSEAEIHLGDRVVLISEEEVAVTLPNHL